MANLIKLIKFGIPLPFGMVRNQKSLISIYNLVDLLIKCIDHPNANGKTFWFQIVTMYQPQVS